VNDNSRQIQNLLKQVQTMGCTVTLRKAGHYKITTPDGNVVFCAQTPSDWRGIKQTRALLRRAGVQV
jgi:hypothetical protein